MSKPLFITGIGTGIGKTVVSAVLVESLKADYWKPIQSQATWMIVTPLKVKAWYQIAFCISSRSLSLTQPFSPHKSAALDGIVIDPLKSSRQKPIIN
jgi:dethiobiotin synthetase